MKPDTVHVLAIRVGNFMQRTRFPLGVIRLLWSYSNPARLGQQVEGLYVKNPVGLSAGFDKNVEIPAVMSAIGFGFMEGGTITNMPYAGNPRPWFHRLPHSESLVVHAGLANEGVDRIIARVKSMPQRIYKDFPLNVSIAQTNVQHHQSDDDMIHDYLEALKKIKQSGIAQMITLNISCPNTHNGEVFTKPAMLERLLIDVDELKLTQPIFLKMPCDLDWRDFDALLATAARHGIAGVTISNLTKDRRDVSTADTLPASVKGGLSGKLVFQKSNQLIAKTYEKYGTRFTIIGVGGVSSAQDAYVKMRLGASLVEMITGLIYQGPQVVGDINRGLVELLDRDGFDSIADIIGIDTKR